LLLAFKIYYSQHAGRHGVANFVVVQPQVMPPVVSAPGVVPVPANFPAPGNIQVVNAISQPIPHAPTGAQLEVNSHLVAHLQVKMVYEPLNTLTLLTCARIARTWAKGHAIDDIGLQRILPGSIARALTLTPEYEASVLSMAYNPGNLRIAEINSDGCVRYPRPSLADVSAGRVSVTEYVYRNFARRLTFSS
jgi:hypothetical protein